MRTPKIIQLIHLFLLITIVTTSTSCSLKNGRFRNADPFYRVGGGTDFLRIPLKKPYDAIKGSDEHGWTIDLFFPSKESSYYLSIFHVKKIGIDQKAIYVYTDSTEQSIKSKNTPHLFWFVILVDEKRERGFLSEDQFLAFIESAGLEEPNWIDINSAYQEFFETGCTVWMPDCE